MKSEARLTQELNEGKIEDLSNDVGDSDKMNDELSILSHEDTNNLQFSSVKKR